MKISSLGTAVGGFGEQKIKENPTINGEEIKILVYKKSGFNLH